MPWRSSLCRPMILLVAHAIPREKKCYLRLGRPRGMWHVRHEKRARSSFLFLRTIPVVDPIRSNEVKIENANVLEYIYL